MPETPAAIAPVEPTRLETYGGYEDEQDPNVREGWHIESLDTADWALRRIAELQVEVEENDSVLAATIAKLQARTEKLNASANRGLEFFSGRLREYAELNQAMLLKGGKKKSRALPSGSIGWKTVPAKLTVTDDAKALAWAEKQPVESELLRIRTEVSKSALAAHFKGSGEVPPGCDVAPEREEFVLKAESAGGKGH